MKRVRPETALLLVQAALSEDDRFLLLEDGSVCLAPKRRCLETLATCRFTILDLETTGGSAFFDRILELGAVRVEGGRPVAEYGTLLNPGVPIPPFIASMTGIQESMVSQAPRFEEVAAPFLDFLGDSVLVAHNLPFDLGFLNRELARACSIHVSNTSLCTVRLGRRLLAHLPDRRLDTVADHYGIPIDGRHRALGDARATAQILIRMIDDLADLGVREMEQLGEYLAPTSGKKARDLKAAKPRRPSPSSAGS